MPTFAYTARDSSGRSVTGTLQAGSVPEALQSLRSEGKYPISVKPTNTPASEDSPNFGPTSAQAGVADVKISRHEVIQISNQLSIMIETGVTLIEAMDCISQQAEKPNVKAILADLIDQLQSGNTFSNALGRHPRSFPRVFTALIKASERTGMMSKLLNRAVGYLRDEQETYRKVKGAMTYPGIMLAFAVTTTIFLLAFVLPRFAGIYANKKAALPVPTKVLMAMSDALIGHWIVILSSTIAVVVGGYFYFRTEKGARVWHFIQLHVPLLGPMFRKLHLSRGLRMVGTMAGAGVNLTDCVTTACDLCPNTHFRELWISVSDQIQTGKQFSEPLFQSSLVPRSVAQMIQSGEKSGKLGFVMEMVATFAEAELKEQIANLTRYIEPIMIVVMGLIIGGVAMALLLPIFTISRVMTAH